MARNWWRRWWQKQRPAADKPKRARRRGEGWARLALEPLEDRTLLSSTFASALDTQLASLQTGLVAALSGTQSIPFVGSQLGNTQTVKQFISGIQSKIDSQLQQELGNANPTAAQAQQALSDALGSQGANLLQGIVHVTDQGGGSFSVEARLHAQPVSATIPLTFSTGLPGLPLQFQQQGNITLGVGFDYELAFQYDPNNTQQPVSLNTAYLSDFGATQNPHHQLAVSVSASLPNDFNATATLGFLYGSASPVPNEANAFTGALYLDNATDATNPTALSLSGGGGGVHVNLQLKGGVGGDPSQSAQIPSVTTQFHLDWQYDSSNPSINAPTVSFDNVGLDLGAFISNFLGPVIGNIEKVTKPFEDVIKVLRYPLPGLSELSNFLGQGDTTLETLLDKAVDVLGFGPVATFVDTVVSVADAVNQFDIPNGELILHLPGSFRIDTSSGPDGSDLGQSGLDPNAIHFNADTPFTAETAVRDAIANSPLDGDTQKKLQDLTQDIFKPVSIKYPIVTDPAQVVLGLLVGQHPDLVSVDLNADPSLHESVASGFSLFGLGVNYVGDLGFHAHLHVGYDTFGIQELLDQVVHPDPNNPVDVVSDLGDGLYIAPSPDSGSGNEILRLSANAAAQAGVSIGFASVSLSGGVYTGEPVDGFVLGDTTTPITVSLDTSNTFSGDGKVRLFHDILYSPSPHLTTSGKLNAGLNVLLSIGVNSPFGFAGYQKSYNIAQRTLVDLTPKPPQVPMIAGLNLDDRSELDLYVGNDAGKRQVVPKIGDETYSITAVQRLLDDGSTENDYEVSAFGFKQYVPSDNITSIAGTAAGENLSVTVAPNVSADVYLDGGSGSAQLTYDGTGHATLIAGSKDSILKGGPGTNDLYAGAGSDALYGGTGRNTFHFGTGPQTIFVTPVNSPSPSFRGSAPARGREILEVTGTRNGVQTVSLQPFLDTGFVVSYLDGPAQSPNSHALFSVLGAGITDLLLAPAAGVQAVDIGDLSGTSFRDVQLSVQPDGAGFLPINVNVAGSAGDDQFNLSDRPVVDQNGKPLGIGTRIELTNPGKPPKEFHLFGLQLNDNVTLDGNGGNNSFVVAPDSLIPLNIAIQDSVAGARDSLTVTGSPAQGGVGYAVPDGATEKVTVTNSSVTFDNIPPPPPPGAPPSFDEEFVSPANLVSSLGSSGSFTDIKEFVPGDLVGFLTDPSGSAKAFSALLPLSALNGAFNVNTVTFGSSVQTLVVDAVTSSAPPVEIDLNEDLRIGHTTLVGGTTANTFNVTTATGNGSLVLDANGAANTTFNVNYDSNGDSNITIQDSGRPTVLPNGTIYQNTFNDTNVLNVNDQGNTNPQGAQYTISPSTVVRKDPYTLTTPGGVVVPSSHTTTISYSTLSSLVVTGGSTGNTFDVTGTADGVNTTILHGGGQDQVNVIPTPSALGNVVSSLRISANPNIGGGSAALNLDDTGLGSFATADLLGDLTVATPVSSSYTVDHDALTRTTTFNFDYYNPQGILVRSAAFTSSVAVNYAALARLTVKDGSASTNTNTFKVVNTVGTGQTEFDLQRSGDTVQIGDSVTNHLGGVGAHDLENINNVNVQGTPGSTVTVDDEADQAQFSLDGRNTHHRISDAGFPAFAITDSALVFQNQGTDTRTDSNGPGGIPSPFAISSTVTYSNIGALFVQGSSQLSTGNVYKVQTTAVPVTITAGSNADTVRAGDPQAGLDGIRGTLTVVGAGNTQLVLDDTARHNATFVLPSGNSDQQTNNVTYVVTDVGVTRTNKVVNTFRDAAGELIRGGPQLPITNSFAFSGLAALSIDGGPTGNHFIVASTGTAQVTINAGSAIPGDPLNPGNDTVDVGDTRPGANNRLLDPITSVTVNGGTGTALNLNDQDNENSPLFVGGAVRGTAPTYLVTAGSVTRTNRVTAGSVPFATYVATVGYNNLSQLTINGGHSGNRFFVQGTPAGTQLTINDGPPLAGDPLNPSTNTVDVGSGLLPGVVSAYAGEGNARDAFGTNNGTVRGNVTFGPGHTGQGFVFDGVNGSVRVPADRSLDVGAGGGLTLAAWIKPSDLSTPRPILEWTNGVNLWESGISGVVNGAPGDLAAGLPDGLGNEHVLVSNPGLLQAGVWQFVALTYDESTGLATLYLNGQALTTYNLPRFTPLTSTDLTLGGRQPNSFDGNTTPFAGGLDDVGIYNRALTPAEIQTLFTGPSLDPVLGPVTVHGQGGSTTLNVNDESTANHEWYSVSATGVLRYPFTPGQGLGTPTQTINYSNVQDVNLHGGSTQDVFGVVGTPAGTSLSLFGGPSGRNGTGGNEFLVANASDTLDDIHGPLAIHGGSIFDLVTANDGLNTVGHTYTVTATSLQRDDLAGIAYDGLGELILATGDNPYTGHRPSSTVNVLNTAANVFTIVAVGAGDTVNLGAPAGSGSTRTLQGFQGQLVVDGGERSPAPITIVADDSGDTQPGRQVTVDTDSFGLGISGLAPSRIYLNVGIGSNVQVLGGTGGGNTLSATFPGDLDQNWAFANFATSSFVVTGNLSGSLLAPALGTAEQPIQQIKVGGSVTASGKIKVGYLGTLTVGGDLAGTVDGYGNSGTQAQPTICTVTVGGNFTGTLTAPVIGSINQKPASYFSGTASETLPGADFQSLVLGTVTSTAVISAGAIVSATVAGDLAGHITVTGPLGTLAVGGNLSGSVAAQSLGSLSVAKDLTGQVSATGTLGPVSVAGNSSGTIAAAQLTSLASSAAHGPVVLDFTQGGVERRLLATPVDGSSLDAVSFSYSVDASGPGDPRLTVHVANADPAHDRFDLSLVSSSPTAGFDLAQLDSPTGLAGLRDLTIDGNLLPVGISLPQDHLGSVAVWGQAAAGALRAGTVEVVAFGSIAEKKQTVTAARAGADDALQLLAPQTGLAQADDVFQVSFGEAQPVALFLVTEKHADEFNEDKVLFTDQVQDNAPVTAQVTVTKADDGSRSRIQTIALQGTGGAIDTALPIDAAITSSGSLGDLILRSDVGLVADVTAPSILGNIEVTQGPLTGTVQTTGGDIGRTLTDAAGQATGTTTVHVGGSLTGRLISRGNLVSTVLVDGDISGVIAAQGDLGALQRDSQGQAVQDRAGHLSRFGGVVADGSFDGQLVVLGNVFGDLRVDRLTGRIAVQGQAVPGLDAGRSGILGNVWLEDGMSKTGAILSGGLIGDTVGGTALHADKLKGIVAAKGAISLGGDTSADHAAFFAGNLGSTAGNPSTAVINAVFQTPFDTNFLDLAGLDETLADLAALAVGSTGQLTFKHSA
jgi:hypothetical protein